MEYLHIVSICNTTMAHTKELLKPTNTFFNFNTYLFNKHILFTYTAKRNGCALCLPNFKYFEWFCFFFIMFLFQCGFVCYHDHHTFMHDQIYYMEIHIMFTQTHYIVYSFLTIQHIHKIIYN